jgi:FkbM family methyltransferase
MNVKEFDPAAYEKDIGFCYRLFLGRKPDPGDREAYGNAVRAGWTVETLVRSFLSSPEFKGLKYALILKSASGAVHGRHANPFDIPAEKQDIEFCYRLLLGRAPDKGGWATYTAFIEEGWTLGRLVATFLGSEEFRGRALAETLDPAVPESVPMHEGFTLYVYSNDSVIGGYIRARREFEPHVTRVLKGRLFPGATFIDIGANVGYFTVLAGRIVGPAGRVYAFEPFPSNVNLIYLNARANGLDNVRIYPFALSDASTAFVVYTVDSNAGLKEFNGNPEEICGRDIVLSTTLDEVLLGLDKVDVLKIDIEGSEYKAIKGGRDLIRRHRPVIATEFFPDSLRLTSGVSGGEYLSLLLDYDYSLSIITETGELLECGRDPKRVLDYFKVQPGDHIDLLAEPD